MVGRKLEKRDGAGGLGKEGLGKKKKYTSEATMLLKTMHRKRDCRNEAKK